MKDYIKFGLVGFAGYLVGFYECKYKMLDVMWKARLREVEAKEKEEAQ